MDGGRRSRTQQKFSSGARTPSRMYGLLFSLINRLAWLSAVQGEGEFIRLHTHTAPNSGSPGHDLHAQRPGRAPTRPRFCTPTDHHAHPSLSPTHACTHSYGLGTATNQCPAPPALTRTHTTCTQVGPCPYISQTMPRLWLDAAMDHSPHASLAHTHTVSYRGLFPTWFWLKITRLQITSAP